VRVAPGARRAEPVRVVLAVPQVGIVPSLEVHVLPGGKPLGDQHGGVQLTAEVPGDPLRELGRPGLFGHRPGPDLEQLAQAARQPAEIADVRRRRIVVAHPSTMPENAHGAKGFTITCAEHLDGGQRPEENPIAWRRFPAGTSPTTHCMEVCHVDLPPRHSVSFLGWRESERSSAVLIKAEKVLSGDRAKIHQDYADKEAFVDGKSAT
jgi:hypothetical protein